MPTPTLITGPRPQLEHALADAVRARQAGDPLRTVHVLVGETLLKPYLRRRLADLLDGHLGVQLVTVAELGLIMGERAVRGDGRTPLPFLADQVLATQVSTNHKGYFEAVTNMPGFAGALHRTLRELRLAGITPAAFARAATKANDPTGKLAALADLYQQHADERAPFYAPDDALGHADPQALGPAGLIVYGVWSPSGLLRTAIERVAGAAPLTWLTPRTGSSADRALSPLWAWLETLGAERTDLPDQHTAGTDLDRVRTNLFQPPKKKPATGDATVVFVSAPDAAREAREAVRAVVRWADEGLPLHEIAIAYRHADRYQAALEDGLREAGLPTFLHEGTSLAERPIGRQTKALLDLIGGDLDRVSVMSFLTDARLPDATWNEYGGISPARWDTISRKAGVVAGLEQWQTRLAGHAQYLAERYGEDPPTWLPEQLDSVHELRRFVTDLADQLDAAPNNAPWSEHVTFLRELLERYVADPDPITDALDGLRDLGALGGTLPFTIARDVVFSLIDGLRADDVLGARQGAFGLRGVQVLDVNSLRSLGFRAVAIVGVAERAFPPPPRQDPLLLDDERIALNAAHGWRLPLRALGDDEEPLQFAGAIAAADERLQVSFPRAEAGTRRPHLPSTFARTIASTLAGRDLGASEVDRATIPGFRRVTSGRIAAHDPAEALSATEHLRAMLEDQTPLARALAEHRHPRMVLAATAIDARWSRSFTPFDGVLSPEGAEALQTLWAMNRPLSPGALETYAGCPHRFLLGDVLRIRPVEEPADAERIDALDRGSAVHTILERFISSRKAGESRAAEIKRLMTIAAKVLDEAEAQGQTGYPLLWRMDRAEILDDLERWLDLERADGSDFDEHEVEVRFGPPYRPDEPSGPLTRDEPLALNFGSGLTLDIAGRIDRVDWSTGRPGFRVTDYKTGTARAKDGELKGGESLQLPLYLQAAAEALGTDPELGEARYWYVTRKGGFASASFTGADLVARADELEQMLGEMTQSIRSGDFHTEPSRMCKWCDFDGVCDVQREAMRGRKNEDPLAVAFANRKAIP